MIAYLDSSVALAHLLAEDKRPPEQLWQESIVSSRLLQYEIWNLLHARGLIPAKADEAEQLLGRIDLLELTPAVLRRALEPFPLPVRTLDALHLATIEFLRGKGRAVQLVSYDARLRASAGALGIAAQSW